ncbi:DUF4142 domain-containing protein [Flavobacterium humi]|uniref:DUF4142 domain-containing protein n=1 Tax=Flavobacterium humi TaxID=2562683 RepID=A0A4Z0LC84_9FLAO|nr:DUF4142 domain-containing protein [Flavobacterium humi]TGD59502.1 DUF4142 domain-containing protein [Flavobacterium humi]
MKKTFILGAALVSAIMLSGSLQSCKQENKQEDPKEAAEDMNDAKFETDSLENNAEFLVDIADVDLTEIEIGKLAQKKGNTQHVKDFGKMLVDDHTKSLTEVRNLAIANNVTLPAALTEKGTEAYNKLNEKSGADFDKLFADMMADGHVKAVDKMSEIADKTTNAEIKRWATDQVGILTGHLEHAKRIQEEVKKK